MNATLFIFSGIGILALAYAGYVVYPLARVRHIDATLVRLARPFTLRDVSKKRSFLILGDSTAVGIGTTPEKSIAGLLSAEFDANVENYAVSGAVSADIKQQAAHALLAQYDLIEIQIGANDIIGFRSLSKAAKSLDTALTSLTKKSTHVVVVTAGDIGKALLFRWPLSRIMSKRTRTLRGLFMEICARHHVTYIDIYSKPDVIASDPSRYHAPDGLHLSADGYAYWYSLIRTGVL